MSFSTVLTVTGPFIKLTGEVLADLKRQELAEIDLDRLKLDKSKLAEALAECEQRLPLAVAQEKARAQQDYISRGLCNNTVSDNALRAIDQDASNELNKALLEYNRAKEEIALMERRLKAKS